VTAIAVSLAAPTTLSRFTIATSAAWGAMTAWKT
jgi:hypothetical protein